jgi:PilZ domain
LILRELFLPLVFVFVHFVRHGEPLFALRLAYPVQYQIPGRGLTFQAQKRILNMQADPRRTAVMDENAYPHKRRSRRVKMARPVRVRPSEPRDEHFEDVIVSVNVSKEGIYFLSRRKGYYKGMRVFVTFPFASPHDAMNCEYVAEVVRVEELPNSKLGVAVDLKMTMNYSSK